MSLPVSWTASSKMGVFSNLRRQRAEVGVRDELPSAKRPEPLRHLLHPCREREVPLRSDRVGLLELLGRHAEQVVRELLQVELRCVGRELDEYPVSVHVPEPDEPPPRENLLEGVGEQAVHFLPETRVDDQVLLPPLERG